MKAMLLLILAGLSGTARAADAETTASCDAIQVPPICTDLHLDKIHPESLKPCQEFFQASTKAVKDTCQFMKDGTNSAARTTTEGAGQHGGEAKAGAQYQQLADFGKKWKPIFTADKADIEAKAKTMEKSLKELLETGKKSALEEIMRCGVPGKPVSFQIFAAGHALADHVHAQLAYSQKLLGEVMIPAAQDLESARDAAAAAKLRAVHLHNEGSDSEEGPGAKLGESTLLYTAVKTVEKRAGDVLVRAIEAVEHVHVTVAFAVVGAGIDYVLRVHSHKLDQMDYVFLTGSALAGMPKSWGLGLTLTAMLAAAEFYLRKQEGEAVKQGYQRYEQWYQGKGYQATQDYSQTLTTLYDSGQVSSRFHDTTVIHNTPDPMNRGLPKNPNPTFQCPTNHSCTAAAVYPVRCGDANWF